jgi:hypothetical protein
MQIFVVRKRKDVGRYLTEAEEGYKLVKQAQDKEFELADLNAMVVMGGDELFEKELKAWLERNKDL